MTDRRRAFRLSSSPGPRREGRSRPLGPGPLVHGFTLLELVIVVAIVGIMAAATLPLARWSVKRQNEYELQENLRILRDAIDRYHDMATAGLIEADARTRGWPPDLETLVEGVELTGEPPPVMPAVSDEYTATGPGLVGGFSGEGRPVSGAVGAEPVGREGQPGAGAVITSRDAGEERGRVTFSADGTSIRVVGDISLQLGDDGRLSVSDGSRFDGPGGALGGGSSLIAAGLDRDGGGAEGSLFADRADRDRAVGPDGQPLRIVFLRRIPIDPMTGEADWGLRCYGDEPDKDLWCGRNVFDVYSKSRASGIDGRPYREW